MENAIRYCLVCLFLVLSLWLVSQFLEQWNLYHHLDKHLAVIEQKLHRLSEIEKSEISYDEMQEIQEIRVELSSKVGRIRGLVPLASPTDGHLDLVAVTLPERVELRALLRSEVIPSSERGVLEGFLENSDKDVYPLIKEGDEEQLQSTLGSWVHRTLLKGVFSELVERGAMAFCCMAGFILFCTTLKTRCRK